MAEAVRDANSCALLFGPAEVVRRVDLGPESTGQDSIGEPSVDCRQRRQSMAEQILSACRSVPEG